MGTVGVWLPWGVTTISTSQPSGGSRHFRAKGIAAADVRKEAVDEVVSEFGNSDRMFGVGVDVWIGTRWPRSSPER
jgi:hypothetical protein